MAPASLVEPHKMGSSVGAVGIRGGPSGSQSGGGIRMKGMGPIVHFPMDPAGLVETHRMGSSVGAVGIRRGSVGIRMKGMGSIAFSNGSGRIH
jgi:hypothetical protein